MGWGEVTDRFDPLPLQAGFFLNRLAAAGEVKLVPFRSVASGFANGFAAGREQQSLEQTPYVQLRPTNLQADGRWTFDKATYLENHDIPAVAKSPKAGSIIFNNTNSQTLVGKSGVWQDHDGITPYLSNHMTEIQMASGLSPDCFAAILNIYRERRVFYNLCTNWNNQSGFSGDRLRALPVPKLTTEQQEVMAIILRSSHNAASAKEAEAAALLASIDDYLLSKLGITLPPETESTLANRTFRVASHELGGWRFDPLFHAFKMWHAIENSGIPSARLGAICSSVKTGFAAGGNDQADGEGGIIQIRPTNIDSDRRLKFDRNVYVSADLPTRRPREILRPGEVLFNNTNSQSLVRKTTFFDLSDQLYACSNHITRVSVIRHKMLPEYLTAVLNLYQRRKAFFSICTNWNNQSGVGADLLRKIVVPVPELAAQQTIVDEVRAIYAKAETLKATATAELETAKSEIEAILLGGAV